MQNTVTLLLCLTSLYYWLLQNLRCLGVFHGGVSWRCFIRPQCIRLHEVLEDWSHDPAVLSNPTLHVSGQYSFLKKEWTQVTQLSTKDQLNSCRKQMIRTGKTMDSEFLGVLNSPGYPIALPFSTWIFQNKFLSLHNHVSLPSSILSFCLKTKVCRIHTPENKR